MSPHELHTKEPRNLHLPSCTTHVSVQGDFYLISRAPNVKEQGNENFHIP